MNWLWGRKQVCDFPRRIRKLLWGIIKKIFKKLRCVCLIWLGIGVCWCCFVLSIDGNMNYNVVGVLKTHPS